MMDNQEDIFDALRDFEKKPPVEIPPLLEQYLNRVASTGETIFPWSNMKPLFLSKLDKVMHQFQNESPMDLLAPCPNVENVKFEEIRTRILQTIGRFHGAPFTIQRLCELITEPKKHYKRTDKFLRGVEKNVLVVSTVDPFGRKIVSESKSLVNGLDVNGHTALKQEAARQGEITEAPSSPKHNIPPPPSTNWTSDAAVTSCMETESENAGTSSSQIANREESERSEAEPGTSDLGSVKNEDDNKVDTSSGSSSSSVETSPSDSPDQPTDMEQESSTKDVTEDNIPESSQIDSLEEPVLTEAADHQIKDEEPLTLPSFQATCSSSAESSSENNEVFEQTVTESTSVSSGDAVVTESTEIPQNIGTGGGDEVHKKEEPSSSEDKSSDNRHAGGDGGGEISGSGEMVGSDSIGGSGEITVRDEIGGSGGIHSSDTVDSSDSSDSSTRESEREQEKGGEEGISSSVPSNDSNVVFEEQDRTKVGLTRTDIEADVTNSVGTSDQGSSTLETASSETATQADSQVNEALQHGLQEDQSKEASAEQCTPTSNNEEPSSALSNEGESECVSSSSENVNIAMETEESSDIGDEVSSGSLPSSSDVSSPENSCSSSVVTETPSTEEPMDQD